MAPRRAVHAAGSKDTSGTREPDGQIGEVRYTSVDARGSRVRSLRDTGTAVSWNAIRLGSART